MNPSSRVVSSRITGRKVLGSANPFAHGFRDAKHGCMDSIAGVGLGFVLLIVAFFPSYCAVKGVKETSKDIAKLTAQTPAQVEGTSGTVMIHAVPENVDAVNAPMACEEIDDYTDLFWYHYVLKEYTRHMEPRDRTETRIENGQEVEYTITEDVEVEDWQGKEDETAIADFSLGNIDISPSSADVRLTDKQTCDQKGRERVVEPPEQWITLDYLLASNLPELYVIGNLASGRISSGTPFIVTDQQPSELIQSLKGEEKTTKTMLTIAGIVLFFIAFNLIIGPLLFLLNYVPLIGPGLRAGIAFISLIMAIVLVLIFQFILKFWWLLLVLIVVIIVLLVVFRKKGGTHQAPPLIQPSAGPTPPPPPPPAAPASPPAGAAPDAKHRHCASCGAEIPEGSKFCQSCGAASPG